MITRVRVEAFPGRRPLLAAEGGLAARLTGPSRVHLVSAAATPVGDDRTEIEVTVHAGAALELATVAATVVYPGRCGGTSRTGWRIRVAAGGALDLAPQPTVVAASAAHETVTEVSLAEDARARIAERVQIGRLEESGGRWRGGLSVDLGGRALVRHTVELGAGAVIRDAALLSAFDYPAVIGPLVSVPPAHGVAVLPLERGGTLTTALGDRVADLDSAVALARPVL